MMLTGIALFVTAAMYAQDSRPAENDLRGAQADGRSVESAAETNRAAKLAAAGEIAGRTDIARTALFGNKFAGLPARASLASQQARLFDGIALPVAPVWRSEGAQVATQGNSAGQNAAGPGTAASQDDDSLIDANTGGSSNSEAR